MNEEIKIITLGDIFKNIETEEKAFKFKDYIKDLQQKVEQLEKENKELNRMCELYRQSLYNADLTKAEKKVEQLESIKKEAIEYINKMWLAKLTPGTVSDTKFDLLNILNRDDINEK